MKLREHTRLAAGSRLTIWTRAAVAGAGALAVAAGALIGATGHGNGPAHVAQKHDAVQPAPPMRLAALAQNEYWMVASDGGIFSFGAPFFGSTGNIHLNKPIVGMTPSPDGTGYWFVASDGGVFAFPVGQQPFYGSMGATPLNSPVVGMAATVTGGGYWLVAADGGIFNFGDAALFGSLGGRHIPAPIVGMASTPDSGGYWLVGADGSVYPFGDAPDFGDMSGVPLNKPVVGMAATPDGGGYWLTATDGGVFAFGDAQFHGSTGNIHLNKPIVGIASTQTGRGYWFVASDGGIFAYGDAAFAGSMGGKSLNQPVVGMAMAPVLFPAHTTVVSSAASVAADGVSQVTVTAETVAQDGEPLPGDLLGFSVDTPGCGAVTPDGGVTDLDGQASVTYTASTLVKSCSVSASELLGPLSGSTSVAQVAGAPAHVTASPSSASSDTADMGNSGIPVTFTVLDANNHPVVGAHVDFTTTLAHGTVSPTSGTTNSNGVAGTSLHDTKVESGVVTATVHGTSVHGSTGTISITAGAVRTFALTPPASATAGTAYNVAATAKDAYGNAANPPASDLTVGGTACDAAPDTTAASCPAPTFSAGTANLSITSYKAQSAATITLADTSAGATSTSTPTTFAINPAAPKKLVGTSPAMAPVHRSDGTTPSGIYIAASDAAQSATITVTLTDQYGNTETGRSDTVTVTLTHNGTPSQSDGGSVPTSFSLTNGVGHFDYAAPMEVSNAYPNNWGNGTITWSDSTFTASPASVPVTTTNTHALSGATSGTSFTADQVAAGANALTVTYTASPLNGSNLTGVQVDFVAAGFDGLPATPVAFDDCSGNAETFAMTATSAGGNNVTVCPHPTKVNSPTTPSQGTVTGWVDGSYVTGNPSTNSPSPTISVTPGTVHTLTLSPLSGVTVANSTNTVTAGGTFTLDALAKDAEGNVTIPTESFTGSYSKAESVTSCGATPFTASATIPNTWSNTGHGTATAVAYLANTGVTLTFKGDTTTAATGTYAINVAAALPAKATWTTTPSTFNADVGSAGVGYAVDIADAYCNLVGGQAVSLTTTLANAKASQGGGTATAFSNATPFTVTTSTTNGANGQAVGRAQWTLFDTKTESGTVTAMTTTGTATAATPTITVTAGKVHSYTLDNPGQQTVDTAYHVTVHAFDNWLNAANPASTSVVVSSTALSPSPLPVGNVPTATIGSFSGGTATVTSTPFLAQSGAVMSVHDTNSSDTFGGTTVNGSTPGFTIVPGAASKVLVNSASGDYTFHPDTATLNLSTIAETVTFTVTVTDAEGNAISQAATPTNQTDSVKITLTGSSSPDGGTLSAPADHIGATSADGANTAVTITIPLSGGTGSFQYNGPLVVSPLNSGAMTFTDVTDGSITSLPASVAITG